MTRPDLTDFSCSLLETKTTWILCNTDDRGKLNPLLMDYSTVAAIIITLQSFRTTMFSKTSDSTKLILSFIKKSKLSIDILKPHRCFYMTWAVNHVALNETCRFCLFSSQISTTTPPHTPPTSLWSLCPLPLFFSKPWKLEVILHPSNLHLFVKTKHQKVQSFILYPYSIMDAYLFRFSCWNHEYSTTFQYSVAF